MSKSLVTPMIYPEDTVLIIIDMQESFRKVIHNFDLVLNSICFLARASKVLKIPIIATEQYPEGLKETVGELSDYIDKKVTKFAFNAFNSEEFRKTLESLGRKNIVLTGIETHICVLQTALSARSHGYNVYLAYDATGSAFNIDKEVAVRIMSDSGVVVVTSESLVYGMLTSSKDPTFKEILPLVKEFRKISPNAAKVLIDERDEYMAAKLIDAMKKYDKIVTVHTELQSCLDGFKRKIPSPTIFEHNKIRRRECAIKGTKLTLELAEEVGNKICIAHCSTAEELDLIRKFKMNNPVYCEITPHHLLLNETILEQVGNFGKVNPPLRTEKDNFALWEAVHDGTVDFIGTDHAPHKLSEKQKKYSLVRL